MKTPFLILFFFVSINIVYAQKNLSLGLGGDFSFATKGLGLNDAALGFHLQGNLFAKRSLQLHIETGIDKFIADKLLAIDMNGDAYERNPAIKRIIAGPEFFWNKKVSTGALYGVVWNNWYNNKTAQDGLKFFLTGYLGKQERFITSLAFTTLPGASVHFFSLSVGGMFYK